MAPLGSLKRSLRKLFRGRTYHEIPSPPVEPEPALAPIQLLPVDVLRYIVDRIPPADAAALALSSKIILNTVGSGILKIERLEDRLEFLKHFEYFFPKHVLCYQCGKFRRLKWNYRVVDDTECERKNGRYQSSLFALNFPFTFAQAIMTRHRYAKNYGPSVWWLNRSTPLNSPHWVVWREENETRKVYMNGLDSEITKAKIVDGQLFIRRDIRMDCDRGFRYCQHLTSWGLGHTMRDFRNGTFIRCLECPTEIRLDINMKLLRSGLARATVWSNLGQCRSPFDSEWRALTRPTDRSSSVYISRDEAKYIHLL